jgi:hypothetical protein
VAAKEQRLESSLAHVRHALIFGMSLTALMAIAALLVCTILFGETAAALSRVDLCGEASVAVQRIYGQVQAVTLHNYGISLQPDNGTAKLLGVAAYVSEFEGMHEELYSMADGRVPAELALFTAPKLPTYELVPGQFKDYDTFNATVRLSSYMNLGIEMCTRARRIANLPTAAVTDAHPDVFFVMYNGIWSVLDAAAAAVDFAMQRSASQGDTILLSAAVVLAVALALFTVVGAGVFIPAIFSITAAKQHTLDLLLDVPLPVVRALRARAFKRLQEEAADGERSDPEADGGGAAFEQQDAPLASDEGLAAVIHAAMRRQASVGKGHTAAHHKCCGAASCCARVGSRAVQVPGSRRQAAVGGSTGRTRLLALFLLPMSIFFAFFGESGASLRRGKGSWYKIAAGY